MRRVVVAAPERVEVRRVPRPVRGPGEVLVRMLVSGVCGSDKHAAHGVHPFVPLPYAPGHEVVGEVVETDDGSRFAAGDKVTVEPTLVCRECKQCRAGRENLCERLRFFGCGHDQGGMADYFTIDESRLHALPPSFSDEDAALVEPLSTPVHAARLAGDLTGKKVAVLGAGTIGLLMLAAARHAGAGRIVVTDPLPGKRDRARRLGADGVLDATSPTLVADVREALGESADVVFDCVATQGTVSSAVEMALKAGTVVVVGVPVAEVVVPLPIIQDQQIRLQGSATYLPEDYAESIAMIADGKVSAEDMVTAVFPLDEADRAFAVAGEEDQVKVLIRGD